MDVAVDILADAVLHSTVDPGEVARERDVILREIAMTHDDPDSRLWEALFSTAFREHPYRQPIIGHRDIFAAVTRDDLYGYYRTRYVPENMVVVIVGDVETAAARAAVERHFGAVPRSRLAPAPVAAEPVQLAPREAHRFEDVELTRAVLSWPIPGLAHPDAPASTCSRSSLATATAPSCGARSGKRPAWCTRSMRPAGTPGTSGLFCVSFTCERPSGRRPRRPLSAAAGARRARFHRCPAGQGASAAGRRAR